MSLIINYKLQKKKNSQLPNYKGIRPKPSLSSEKSGILERIMLQLEVVLLPLSTTYTLIYSHSIFEAVLRVGRAWVGPFSLGHLQICSPGISCDLSLALKPG